MLQAPVRSVNDELFDRIVAHHVNVQRLAADAVASTVRRLNASDAEIFEVVGRYAIERRGIDRLLRAIRTINDRTYQAIAADLSKRLRAAARYEAEHVAALVADVLPIDWTIRRPKFAHLDAIVDEEPVQGGLVDEWIEGLAQGRYVRARTAVRLAESAGEGPDDVIRRIRGTRGLNYRDGVADVSRRAAQGTITTLVNHVVNHARATVATENFDLFGDQQWSAVLDGRTCLKCLLLDGKFESTFPTPFNPPAHINCRCTWIPVIRSWNDLPFGPDELSETAKAKLSGAPAKVMSFREWLEGQDAETQDDLLGRERGLMFRRGGVKIDKFIDHSGKLLTLPELRKIEERKLVKKPQPRRSVRVAVPRRLNLGWKPDLPDQRDLLFAVEHPEDIALPVRVSLRDRMPPVFDQGNLGSCTANALVAAMMYAFGPKTPMLSRLDLYYKEREIEGTVDEDVGAEIRDGVKALAKWGVCTEETWPYRVRYFKTHPPPAADEEDDTYRIKKYTRLKSQEDFQRSLAMGVPFVGGFSVYQNFDLPTVVDKGILTMPTVDQKLIGGHAVLFVGYDSDFTSNPIFKQSGLQTSQVSPLMFEVRNSFGASWGDDGYYWMPAAYVQNRDLADDFWSFMK